MRFTFGNTFFILFLLFTVLWFLYGYSQDKIDWTAGLMAIAALAGIFAKKSLSDASDLGKTNSKHDTKLFEKFLTDLPMQPTIQLLKDHNFENSFNKDSIQPLFDFVYDWSNADHEFKNRKIERDRKKLLAQAQDLADKIIEHTTPVGDGRLLSVFSDSLRAKGERPDHVSRSAKILNERAEVFVRVYEAFVRKCRNKIAT